MSRDRIKEQFESYRRDVLPPDAPDIQIDECRKAFYAGAYATLAVTHEAAVRRDAAAIQDVKEELEEFARFVGGGS